MAFSFLSPPNMPQPHAPEATPWFSQTRNFDSLTLSNCAYLKFLFRFDDVAKDTTVELPQFAQNRSSCVLPTAVSAEVARVDSEYLGTPPPKFITEKKTDSSNYCLIVAHNRGDGSTKFPV